MASENEPGVNSKNYVQNALRVSQLDASELDSELFDVIKSQLNNTFKYFKPAFLTKYTPEIHAIIRLIFWKLSVSAHESTVGQQLLDLRYQDVVSSEASRGSQWMSARQKVLYGVLTVGAPWLDDRKPQLQSATAGLPFSDKVWHAIEWLSKVCKVLSLVNFLVFLTQGRYQLLIERLLRVRAVFPRPVGARQVGFEYMDRELLWHGFAEFLFFVLPLINFRRIKNFLVRHLVPASVSSESSVEHSSENCKECVVCGQWPYNPRHIGCAHVFCYYCIQSNYEADRSYTCPVCGQRVGDVDNIQTIKLSISKPS